MKTTISILAILLVSIIIMSPTHALADTPYIVEPMICKGKIFGNTAQVHPSYAQIMMKFNNFYSTRKDGSLALSLNVQNDYAPEGYRMDEDNASWVESWFMGPITRDGNEINDKVLVSFQTLKLKITQSRELEDGRKLQILDGLLLIKYGSVGNYGYRLKCKAIVVKQPSGVMDLTR